MRWNNRRFGPDVSVLRLHALTTGSEASDLRASRLAMLCEPQPDRRIVGKPALRREKGGLAPTQRRRGPSYVPRFLKSLQSCDHAGQAGKGADVNTVQAPDWTGCAAGLEMARLSVIDLPGPTGEFEPAATYGRGYCPCLGDRQQADAAETGAHSARDNGCHALAVAPVWRLQFASMLCFPVAAAGALPALIWFALCV